MANPKTFTSDFERGVKAALDVCGKVRDERPLPRSWTKEFKDGYVSGGEACCAMIINELHPKL